MKPQQSSGRHDTVIVPGQTAVIESLPWNPRPEFIRVSRRHLATLKDIGGRMSLHHVRIDPGCAIGNHASVGPVEIHTVLNGPSSSTCRDSDPLQPRCRRSHAGRPDAPRQDRRQGAAPAGNVPAGAGVS